MSDRSAEEFLKELNHLLEKVAKDKGYNDHGTKGDNKLYEFIHDQLGSGSHVHALGEIVYKAVRYNSKKNPEDLVKIAAWALLVWQHHQEPESPHFKYN